LQQPFGNSARTHEIEAGKEDVGQPEGDKIGAQNQVVLEVVLDYIRPHQSIIIALRAAIILSDSMSCYTRHSVGPNFFLMNFGS
jgi:hypothetical protein